MGLRLLPLEIDPAQRCSDRAADDRGLGEAHAVRYAHHRTLRSETELGVPLGDHGDRVAASHRKPGLTVVADTAVGAAAGGHSVPDPVPRHTRPNSTHDSGHLVSQDQAAPPYPASVLPDLVLARIGEGDRGAPPRHGPVALHQVVPVDRRGLHLDQDLFRTRRRRILDLHDLQVLRRSGLKQHACFHGSLPLQQRPLDRSSRVARSVQIAGNPVPRFKLLEDGAHVRAFRHRDRTARMESAPGGWIQRTRYLAPDHHTLRLRVGVIGQRACEQRLRVGVEGV